MARDRRVANLTLAHVALKLACAGCHNGSDEVHLTATGFGVAPGRGPDKNLVWMMPLVERPVAGARYLRRMPDGEVFQATRRADD